MRSCSTAVLTLLCWLASAEEDSKRQTFVVRYKNGEQTIPVTVVLDHKKQTEYVINMNSRTPSKSVTLYDFKQRTIAYKDLSNQECFLGRLTHETINNESIALQLLKNPVESKSPTILSMDAHRPALTPTEVKNIAGQKTAVFCRRMSTWLLAPLNAHDRKKRASDNEDAEQQPSSRNAQSSKARYPRRKPSIRRQQTKKNAASRKNEATGFAATHAEEASTKEILSLPSSPHQRKVFSSRPGRKERSYLHRHILRPDGEQDRFNSLPEERAIDDHEDRISKERFLSFDGSKDKAAPQISIYKDIDSNQRSLTERRSRNFHTDVEHLPPSYTKDLKNTNTFESLSREVDEPLDETQFNTLQRNQTHSGVQIFRPISLRETEDREYPNPKSGPLHKSESQETELHLPPNTLNSEEREKTSESVFEIDHREQEYDIISPSVRPQDKSSPEFSRIIQNLNFSKFGDTEHSSDSDNYETNDGYLSLPHVQDFPILKNDYYDAYLFPNLKETDQENEQQNTTPSSVLNNRLPLPSFPEHANLIYRNTINSRTYSDSFTRRTSITTESPSEYYYNTNSSIGDRNVAENEIDDSTTGTPYDLFRTTPKTALSHTNLHLPLDVNENSSHYPKGPSENSKHRIYSKPITSEPVVTNSNRYVAPNHRSDIPSEDNSQDGAPIPNVTINEGFPPYPMRIQNVLRLFTPDEIVIDIEKLPTVETTRSVAGFRQRPKPETRVPTRKISTLNRHHKNRNEQRRNSTTSKPPYQSPSKVLDSQKSKTGITYHVRQDTRFNRLQPHVLPHVLPPGVSMHPRHPQAPFADLAQRNGLPAMLPEDHPYKPHRQRHKKHRNSCCQQRQGDGAVSSCCRDSSLRRRRGHHKKAPLMDDSSQSNNELRYQPEFQNEQQVVVDTRDRCEREKMCRTLYQSTQRVLVCRNVNIEGC